MHNSVIYSDFYGLFLPTSNKKLKSLKIKTFGVDLDLGSLIKKVRWSNIKEIGLIWKLSKIQDQWWKIINLFLLDLKLWQKLNTDTDGGLISWDFPFRDGAVIETGYFI